MAPDDEGLQFSLDFFGDRVGYLVDVGAHDGVAAGSMSRAFTVKGWSGLLVEPLPGAFHILDMEYADNSNVVCVQAACSNEEGIAMLHPFGGVSTLEKPWRDACANWWPHVRYTEAIQVHKTTLARLLDFHNAPTKIDYLQIDTEGHDYKVLLGMDWNYDPDLICIETLDMVHPDRKDSAGICLPPHDTNYLLYRKGYELVLTTKGGNGFYVKGKK